MSETLSLCIGLQRASSASEIMFSRIHRIYSYIYLQGHGACCFVTLLNEGFEQMGFLHNLSRSIQFHQIRKNEH